MLQTGADIIGEVLVRSGVTTTATGLYTDTILRGELDNAHRWASSAHKWPFTEGRVSTTFVSEETEFPEGWRPDSIRILQVGGKRYQKINFEDYQMYRENEPSGEDKVYSDFGLSFFVNPNGAGGTTTLYGQYLPATLDATETTVLTVFSNRDQDANEAIVEKMLAAMKTREKKFDEAKVHMQVAVDILTVAFGRYTDEQFAYHTKDRGIWERVDVLEGEMRDEVFKRDQFI